MRFVCFLCVCVALYVRVCEGVCVCVLCSVFVVGVLVSASVRLLRCVLSFVPVFVLRVRALCLWLCLGLRVCLCMWGACMCAFVCGVRVGAFVVRSFVPVR